MTDPAWHEVFVSSMKEALCQGAEGLGNAPLRAVERFTRLLAR